MSEDDEVRQLHQEVARRQYRPRRPKRIADVLSTLMARRGYAHLATDAQCRAAWQSVVGEQMSPHSRIGNIRRGVVEVTVCNSAVLQELTFRKAELTSKLAGALPEKKIRDLRFRVGSVK